MGRGSILWAETHALAIEHGEHVIRVTDRGLREISCSKRRSEYYGYYHCRPGCGAVNVAKATLEGAGSRRRSNSGIGSNHCSFRMELRSAETGLFEPAYRPLRSAALREFQTSLPGGRNVSLGNPCPPHVLPQGPAQMDVERAKTLDLLRSLVTRPAPTRPFGQVAAQLARCRQAA